MPLVEARPVPPVLPTADGLGLWQWDALTGEVTWSSPVARLLGRPAGARFDLEDVRAALVGDDRSRFDIAVRAVASGRGVAGVLSVLPPGANAPRQIYAWSEVRREERSGRLLGAWGGVVDVTAFDQDTAAARSGLAGLRAAQRLAGLATWEWHPGSGRLIWSPEMYRLLSLPADRQPDLADWHAAVHPEDLPRARRLDLDAAPVGEQVETFRVITPDGLVRHVRSWSTAGDPEGPDSGVVFGACIDVTRQVQDKALMERLAITDPVTGLGNRSTHDLRISELVAEPGRQVSLLLLDLQRFAAVNSSLGHQAGDRLLSEAARRLQDAVPPGSRTARLGGDEFAVLPPDGLTEFEVRRLAATLADVMLPPYTLPDSGESLLCPARIGVAVSAGRVLPGRHLMREADIALCRAKELDRDRVVVFDETLRIRTEARLRVEHRLRHAVAGGRFAIEYQPIVDFADGRVVGTEALVRLCEPDPHGTDRPRLVAPELFLDVAEQTGLVLHIDAWVIEEVIAQLGRWQEERDHVPWVAINLSARSLEHPQQVRRLTEAVRRGELPADLIKVELAERSFVGPMPGVEASVRQLIANGIGVGIDDFGTGRSALAQLQHFDLEFLKLDRSFVAEVGESARGDAVATAMLDLAHAYGMAVVAEGVESGRQARRLREIGCDYAQGFHFGRPAGAGRISRG